MRGLTILCLVLIVIGAINWGLIGFFGFNLVDSLFGSLVSRIIYALVGLAGVYGIFMLGKLIEDREDVCVPGHHVHVTS